MSYVKRLETAININHVYAGNGPAEALVCRLMEAVLTVKSLKAAWKRELAQEVVLQRLITKH